MSYAGSWADLVSALTQVRRVVVVDAQTKLVNYITQSDALKLCHQRGLLYLINPNGYILYIEILDRNLTQ